jgi:hypothetical protein
LEELRRMPGQNQNDLNEDLFACIERLNPDDLANRIGRIHARLTRPGEAITPFVAELSAGLDRFRDACERLRRVMADHDACQAFETVVALAADSRGAIPPSQIPGWAVARARLAAVVLEAGDDRPNQVDDLAGRFEAAAAAGVSSAAPPELGRLLGMFRAMFNEIDKKLLALTDRLVQSAAYLDVQLRTATHVNL